MMLTRLVSCVPPHSVSALVVRPLGPGSVRRILFFATPLQAAPPAVEVPFHLIENIFLALEFGLFSIKSRFNARDGVPFIG